LTKQTQLLKQVSAKVRNRGIKPFTKAFGRAMKAEFKKLKKSRRSSPKKSKKGGSKRRNTTKKSNKTSKKKNPPKKSVAKGTKGMTRIKKFLLGIGIGAAVSTVAGFARVPEIEASGPIIDAAVGGGVEAQIGTAIPRLIRTVILRSGGGFNGNGNGGLALEGA